jgi:hypothetical protein
VIRKEYEMASGLVAITYRDGGSATVDYTTADLDGLKSAFIAHLKTGKPEYVELRNATHPSTVIIRLSSVRSMEFLPCAP